MITFTIALLVLIGGYFIYGRGVEKIFAPDETRPTPAVEKADGVDYMVLPNWKIFLIQFLNIAGLGPIFGAIMGARFGTASYLWIVFGTIFAGAVHDFFSGGLSIRLGGERLPELVGRYMGNGTRRVMTIFAVFLLILVGSVFTSGPAELLAGMTPAWMDVYFWLVVIFAYFILATLCPIDKIIGRFYPLFALALLFMAAGLVVMLFVKHPALPEMWESFGTKYETDPIFPMMFISIACGAVSGFHATQSPLMARCMKSERQCRPIFYGAMVTEGIVALIWAAVATYFFAEHGTSYVDANGAKVTNIGAYVATNISVEWLGTFGGILALLGVVIAPITTGDTALRSARLMIADFFHISQKKVGKRLLICIPLFIATAAVLCYSLADATGFKIVWRYFAWCNQTLSVFTLWTITVWLSLRRSKYLITLIPALFMTCVCTTYICVASEGFGLPFVVGYTVGGVATVAGLVAFIVWKKKLDKTRMNNEI